jgi:carbonic anhydrase/acetyltransferase-like protein (isoleucine patch superfamily)
MVLGAPAKVVKTLGEEQVERMQRGAGKYVGNWQRYKAGLTADG